MLVSTGDVTNILTNSSDVSGMVVDIGEGATQHGHCYGTSSNVTVAGSKTQLGTPPVGGFTSQLISLTAGTKYYIKAYISDGAETVYGKEISFTTQAASLPSVTTAEVTSVTTMTATCGGDITNDGGALVTARGVCWSTSTNPTSEGSKTSDGPGTGVFTSNLTGLTPNTTYYVRAYATNSAGTAYGEDITFTTNPIVPTLTTSSISSLTSTSASSGGNVTFDGGAAVEMRGVCWSTNPNPTTSDFKTDDGTGIGTFSSELTGLTPGTIYYVRSFATNSIGTGYGNEVSFRTFSSDITISDIDGNSYHTITIGSQVWLVENLKSTRYSDGTSIPLVSNTQTWNELTSASLAYCWYDNDINYEDTYGALYTWAAAMKGAEGSSNVPSRVQGVCLTGWHVPSYDEWVELATYLGDNNGGKLKETGTAHWESPNEGATNESGFTGLPGGKRDIDGQFFNLGRNAYWWSATEISTSEANHLGLYYANNYLGHDFQYDKRHAYSVRCVKD